MDSIASIVNVQIPNMKTAINATEAQIILVSASEIGKNAIGKSLF
jgi:hypothetical protein